MCSIFGVLDYRGKLEPPQRQNMVRALSIAAEARGTDATGIAFFHSGSLRIQKAPKPAHRMKFNIPNEAQYIMGHTRMTTQGSERKNQNNHPFPGNVGGTKFALAHNGVLINDRELALGNQLPQTNIETDSYVAVQLIEKQNEVSPDSLRRMAEVLEGHFTFTVLDQKNNLYFIKGNNPLTIYHYPQMGLYLYASTQEILETAVKTLGMSLWKKEIIQPKQGDILRINRNGKRTTTRFDDTNISHSWWSYIPSQHISRENEHMSLILEMADYLGVPRQEMLLFSKAGYSAWDMEDLLYDDELRACCLEEIRMELAAW